jgi:hypothetical protein
VGTDGRVACRLLCALLVLSAPLRAQDKVASGQPLPAFGVRLADGTTRFYRVTEAQPGCGTVSDQWVEASVQRLGPEQWKLRLQCKQTPLRTVWFPWQPEQSWLGDSSADDIVYYPALMGVVIRADSLREWGWRGGIYPGYCFAPLVVVADRTSASIVAAANWPPKRVRPYYSLHRVVLCYEEPVQPGDVQEYHALISHVQGDAARGRDPWRLALDKYGTWLRENMRAAGLYPLAYSEWLRESHGWISVQLENYRAFDVDELRSLWQRWHGVLPWMQFWGQMSNYAGPANLAVPPLRPDEAVGCCLDEPRMHPRYLPELLRLVREITSDGRAGYYARPRSPYRSLEEPDERKFLLTWLQKNREEYGANAFYIDVLGGRDFGAPLSVARMLQSLDSEIVIEYPVDVYPVAYLVSGCLQGGNWEGGPGRSVEELGRGRDRTTFPRFGRYLLNDRVIFLGENNSDWRFWGREHDCWTERQAFLLGAKFDAIHPDRSPLLKLALTAREKVRWWKRNPVYLDRAGISDVPPGVDVRRFEGEQGETLFAVDNPGHQQNAVFSFEGRTVPVPASALSALVLEK